MEFSELLMRWFMWLAATMRLALALFLLGLRTGMIRPVVIEIEVWR